MSLKNKKEILSIIIFSICLIFAFVYIKPLYAFISYIFKLLTPFIIGIVIAYILNILVNFIQKKLFTNVKIKDKSKKNLSIILSIALVISFLSLVMVLLIPQFKKTTDIFIDNLPSYQKNVTILLDKVGVNNEVRENIIDKTKDFADKATVYFKENSGAIFQDILGVATNVITSIVNLTIAIIFALYLLVEKERILRQLNKLFKAYLPEKKNEKLRSVSVLSNKIFTNFISGQFLEAVIIGLLCFVGMLILNIPYAGTISILVGFTALIPVFGAFIGTFIGAFLIFMVSPIKALIFIIYIIILQQIEGNLIYPKVMGKRVNLPGIWVLVAVTIGASVSGVVGMLISVPLVSILYSILSTNVNLKLKKRSEK